MDDTAEAIRNNPASDFTGEELRKKIEAVSTEEGLEMRSRLLKVAAENQDKAAFTELVERAKAMLQSKGVEVPDEE